MTKFEQPVSHFPPWEARDWGGGGYVTFDFPLHFSYEITRKTKNFKHLQRRSLSHFGPPDSWTPDRGTLRRRKITHPPGAWPPFSNYMAWSAAAEDDGRDGDTIGVVAVAIHARAVAVRGQVSAVEVRR